MGSAGAGSMARSVGEVGGVVEGGVEWGLVRGFSQQYVGPVKRGLASTRQMGANQSASASQVRVKFDDGRAPDKAPKKAPKKGSGWYAKVSFAKKHDAPQKEEGVGSRKTSIQRQKIFSRESERSGGSNQRSHKGTC
jgi:hypothetical protein